jgi:anaerobic selenocysteine-containing dehydrogenase
MGVAAGLSGCGGSTDQLLPLLIPEETIPPGTDRWTPGTCPMCPGRCGILIRSMPGEARVAGPQGPSRQIVMQVKKVEGNPVHPVNQGRTCARGQAAPQILYNPDRLQTPQVLDGPRGSREYKRTSWNEALKLLQSRLAPLRSSPAGLAAISGYGSPSRARLLREFLEAAGSSRCYLQEPSGFATLREANRRVFGIAELENHDIEHARYVLCFGANILEAHSSPVRYNLGLARFRQGRPGLRGKFVQVESRFSLTAANADEWLPARPGAEASVALSIAHVLLSERLVDGASPGSPAAGFDLFRKWVLERFAPEQVAKESDVPAKTIVRIAREFAGNLPCLALAGGSAIAHEHGLQTAMAVQALNVLAGTTGKPGGVSWMSGRRQATAPRATRRSYWAQDFVRDADSIQLLILWDANPVYEAPASTGLVEAMNRIPFIVAFSAAGNESTAHADLVLPDATFLETWDLFEPEPAPRAGVLSIAQPAVRPMYESRDRADVLLGIAADWGGKVPQLLPDPDYREYLKRTLRQTGSTGNAGFEEFWSGLVQQGVWTGQNTESAPPNMNLAAVIGSGKLPSQESTDYPFYLVPFETTGLGTGREANLPWLQELPDPMSSVVWGAWLEINPRSAAGLGVGENEWVWVESRHGRIRIPALLNAAARPDTVSMPFGQGHASCGRYASGRGASPWSVVSPAQVQDTGEPAWADTRVRIRRTGEKAPIVRIGNDRVSE